MALIQSRWEFAPCTQGQAGLSLVATSLQGCPQSHPWEGQQGGTAGWALLGHLGTESALTELAELISTCLAGQGLKLSLGEPKSG